MKFTALLALILCANSYNVFSQSCPLGLSGTFKVGPTGAYLTLQAALTDLHTKGITGPVLLEIQSSYTSAGETFPLTCNAVPCASQGRGVTIRPEAGAGQLSITASSVTTLDLNNGSWFTIDGRPGGADTTAGHRLVISNTTTGGSAIRFVNGATHNELNHLDIHGVNNGGGGVVFFSGSDSAVGNGYNRIDSSNISAGATPPICGVYGIFYNNLTNRGNTINGCNIFNVVGNNSFTACGVDFVVGYDSLVITKNSFYQTADLNTPANLSVTQNYTAISVGTDDNGGHLISGNFIGGTAPKTAGVPMQLPLCHNFTGIKAASKTGAAMATRISNNTIGNITWPDTYGNIQLIELGDLFNYPAFNGSCTGNILGGDNSGVSLNITNSRHQSDTTIVFMGILFNADAIPDQVVISNNYIGGIWADANTSGQFFGINMTLNGYYHGSYLVKDNTIGSEIEHENIWWHGNGWVDGIYVFGGDQGPDSLVISGNHVANLNAGSVLTDYTILRGIEYGGDAYGPRRIDSNTVHALYTNAHETPEPVEPIYTSINDIEHLSTGNFSISGNTIYSNGAGGGVLYSENCSLVDIDLNCAGATGGLKFTISHNRIQDRFLSDSIAASGTAAFSTAGIQLQTYGAGTSTIDNNMIQMVMGAGATAGAGMTALNDLSGNNRYIHNTVYIRNDAPKSGVVCFTAFHQDTTANTASTVVMNNIFAGVRPAPDKAFELMTLLGAPQRFHIDYNLFYPVGGYIGSPDTTLAQWQAQSGYDGHSIMADPLLVRPDGGLDSMDLHVQNGTPAESAGTSAYTTLTDFDGRLRADLTPVDIGAHAGNFNGVPPPPPNDTTRHDSTGISPPPGSSDTTGLVRPFGNPFSSTLTLIVNAPTAGTAQLFIYDFSGNLLLSTQTALKAGDNTVTIPMGQFPNGTYLVRVDVEGKHETIQVMKNG